MKLTEYTLSDFIEKTQDTSSLPGGGSICALNGALAASLTMMVIRLSQKNFSERERTSYLDTLEKLTYIMEENIQMDGESYDKVIAAKALPQRTEEERGDREKAISAAYIHTTAVPLRTMEGCLAVLKILSQVGEKISPYAVTDLFISADLALVGLEGAGQTAELNISAMPNREKAGEFREKLNFLRIQGTEFYNLIKKG